jgi:hypothetical protein
VAHCNSLILEALVFSWEKMCARPNYSNGVLCLTLLPHQGMDASASGNGRSARGPCAASCA